MRHLNLSLLMTLLLYLVPTLAVYAEKAEAEDVEFVCPDAPKETPKWPKAKTYEGVPFSPGEEMVFECSYAKMKAGYGTLSVEKPRKYKGRWHRVYRVKAKTGEWFDSILTAEEKLEAISRPWDFGISKFYLEQNEGQIFRRPFQQQKWLEFDHDKCKVKEKILPRGGKPKTSEFDFFPGGIDALGVVYYMRTLDLQVNKPIRAPVYSSEKNWWLEVYPIKEEFITVPAGRFKAMKVKLQTFIGKDLQQKGDVFAWVATEHPSRPIVQIEGEIKIGSVWLKLQKFKPGKAQEKS